jgi:hypothetical protein
MIRHVLSAMALALFALAASTVQAASPQAEEIERSMLVTGSVDIEPDGSVGGHKLDDPDKLPPGVVRFVDQAVGNWRFEPILVDGQPVAAQTRMSLRLVARAAGSEFRVSIRGVNFGTYDPETMPSYRSSPPPRYPQEALHARVGGDVYAVARIGRDGSVEEVVAEQVNLRTAVPAEERPYYEQSLATATLRRIKRWKFNPPTGGGEADAPFWTVRIPVSFMISGTHRKARYGQWEAYLPGTYTPAPWRGADDATQSADALAAEGLYPLNSNGPRLLSALESG